MGTYFDGEVEHKFLEEVGDAAEDTFRMAVLSPAGLEESTHKAGNMLEEDMDYLWEEPY